MSQELPPRLQLGPDTDPLVPATQSEDGALRIAYPNACTRLGSVCKYVCLSVDTGGPSFSTEQCERAVTPYSDLVAQNETCGFAVDAILKLPAGKGAEQ